MDKEKIEADLVLRNVTRAYESGVDKLSNARMELKNQLHTYAKALLRFEEIFGNIAMQKTTKEMDADELEDADFEGAYDTMIEMARAALKEEI